MLNFYVYGPSDMSVEQINNGTGTVQYLQHDQAGQRDWLFASRDGFPASERDECPDRLYDGAAEESVGA
jgi:hypothetical protein